MPLLAAARQGISRRAPSDRPKRRNGLLLVAWIGDGRTDRGPMGSHSVSQWTHVRTTEICKRRHKLCRVQRGFGTGPKSQARRRALRSLHSRHSHRLGLC